MRLLSIASGSSGNCIYVGCEDTNLLVDAGISMKRIEAGLNTIDYSLSDMDGILITHEHSDHIAGLKAVSKKYHLPLYATKGTIAEISSKIKEIDTALFHEISADNEFELKSFLIDPIRISHDAADPVGYGFYSKSCFDKGASSPCESAAVCTDLGTYDDYIIDKLSGVSTLLLEANHDIKMLEAGPYPYYLKRRILSEKGHLSNDSAGELLSRLYSFGRLNRVLLGHLSKENNYAALAFETVRMQLNMLCGHDSNRKMELGIAFRDTPGSLITA
ncbi:MAG: MBL fold metallo-hydrolase [Lachnospiraceae bacterium]|nr:MBL fold metallo-hydrolase [Lachnospiraceae bacterium]